MMEMAVMVPFTLPRSVVVLESTRDFVLARVPVKMPKLDVYQRRLRAHKVAEMVRNWQPHRAQVCLLNLREDGSLYIVDGQHRITAMMQLEVPMALCEIINVPQDREPVEFVRFNFRNSIPVNAVERFHAALIAGEPWAVRINDIVIESGFSIAVGGKSGMIHAVDALERIYAPRSYAPREDLLRDVLRVVQKGWCTPFGLNLQEQGRCLRSDLLLGIALLHRSYGTKLHTPTLIAHLSKVSIETFDRRLMNLISVAGISTKHVGVAQVLWQVYNHRLPAGKRLPLLDDVIQRF